LSRAPNVVDVLHETIIMGALNHACVLKLFNVAWRRKGSQPEALVLLMEYCAGGTLNTLLYDRGKEGTLVKRAPSRVDDALTEQLARELLAGLVYLKEQGVVHRDIKPSNLGLERDPSDVKSRSGRPLLRIMDFGISRLLVSGDERKSSGLGSAFYKAPEVIGTADDYDFGSDLYSAALVLNELRTQEVPYLVAAATKECSQFELIGAITEGTERPSLGPNCPPCFRELIESCWCSDRKHRWSVEQALHFVEECRGKLLDPRRPPHISSPRQVPMSLKIAPTTSQG